MNTRCFLAMTAIAALSLTTAGCSSTEPQQEEPPVAPAPRLRAEGKTKGCPPTPEELADAKKAYRALGGDYRRDEQPGGEPVHHFTPPYPLTAEGLVQLPDLPFDYVLNLPLGPDTTPGILKRLGRLRNLRSVSVSHAPGQDEGNLTPRISELAEVPNLEHLYLYSGARTPLTDELAESLATFPALRRLTGGEGPISDKGLKSLSRHPKLEALSLQCCEAITDAGLAHLAAMPNLRVLVLERCDKLTAAGLRPFTKEPRLTELAVNGTGMKADALAEVGKIRTLEWLNLYSFNGALLTEQGLRQVTGLPRLRRLDLPFMTHTDAGLKELAAASGLEEVGLFGCSKVTDAGVKELARLTKLKSLDMRGAEQITDRALSALSGLPELETFYLTDAKPVTDKGMKAFIDGRGETLVRLGLDGLSVSDNFVAYLPKKAPRLKSLHFSRCEAVTDDSITALSEMTQLRDLSVNKTSVSPEGVNVLKQKLPECRVDGPRRSPD
ncbi:MAG: hypothetical protein J0I06_20420 [Planctomycetes bacterium]|nr:hypothetical protein [Planctomycetota bacterium]